VLDAPEVGRTLKALSDAARAARRSRRIPTQEGMRAAITGAYQGRGPAAPGRRSRSRLPACLYRDVHQVMLLLSRPDTFTEGFDTADLKEAEALLDELAEPAIAAAW
jgi:hypothetical protein